MSLPDALAPRAADAVAQSFVLLRARFDALTRRAAEHFATCDWRALHRDAKARLLLYARHTDGAVSALKAMLADRYREHALWLAVHDAYARCIAEREDHETAATFFNSVTRRVFGTVGVDPTIEFLGADLDGAAVGEPPTIATTMDDGSAPALLRLLGLLDLGAPWADAARDAAQAGAVIDAGLRDAGVARATRLELLATPFYRNKGAYLVGRVIDGPVAMPVVLALLHGPDGIYVDAALTSSDEASVVFGFSWSYFHVAVEHPAATVAFLASTMPLKRVDELYTAIGFHKHGKTELYRGMLRHLGEGAVFERAQGQPGLVMTVIALPSFNLVLKIIRDTFGPPKRITHREVMAQYRFVFLRDRVGRLADAQEFERLELPRSAFPDALLADLLAEAPSNVRAEGDDVVIRHCYAQRRLTPLDVYLRDAPPEAARAAIRDYGEAIADMAHAGIFPGDMLLKNFGLSRHGRVIFYDYDEVQELDDVVFREMPTGGDDLDDVSSEPWFSVGEHDVFPEEFLAFMVPAGPLREEFVAAHGELLTAGWWTDVQERLRAGELFDVYPYPPERRLRHA